VPKKQNNPPKLVKRMTVLAMDMGVANTALTVIRVLRNADGTLRKVRLKHGEMVQPLITDLNTPLQAQVRAFKSYISEVVKFYQPDAFVGERFISRGLRGAMGEKVTMMLTLVASICDDHKIPYALVTAGAWKNRFTKKAFSKDELEWLYRQSRKHMHLMDSMLIASDHAGVTLELRAKNRLHRIAKQIWMLPVPKRPSVSKKKKQ
jgi:hypothetical protein